MSDQVFSRRVVVETLRERAYLMRARAARARLHGDSDAASHIDLEEWADELLKMAEITDSLLLVEQ